MTPELTALTLAALLQVAQFALMAIPANIELGPAKTMSPRDKGTLQEQLSPKTARLARALNNHFEGLILFTIACMVITLTDQSTPLTAACAWIYLAARILYVATEIKVETVPPFLVALPLALVAGVIVPLLAGSAARAARAVSLTATRTPEWGREMLFAHKFVDRCALRCSVLIAPLVAALLWLEPCARLWVSGGGGSGGGGGSSDGGDDGSAERRSVDALRSFSLLLAALSSVCAARPSVVAHCGTALVVWWTRKHGFVSRRNGKKKKKGGGSVAAAVEKEETEAEAASRRLGSNWRAGEVLRLSMQFINLFALKAGVQALAPGLLWLGCGAVSSSSALGALLQSKNGSENGSGSGSGSGSDLEQISLWLGGWSAAVFALCSLWHLALYWCGWLTDVPAGGKR